MTDIEEVFGRIGLALAAAQIMEKRLVYLLVHLTYEKDKAAPPLAEVYDRLEEPLGSLISIWRKYGMPIEWERKMENVRKQRNWVAHKCVLEREDEIRNNPTSLILVLQNSTDMFHELTSDLDELIEERVQAACKLRGIPRSALTAITMQRFSEIAKTGQ